MDHEVLTRVLDVQRLNSTLSGMELRNAAHELLTLRLPSHVSVLTCDPAGERILGFALALNPDFPTPHDRSQALRPDATCLLIAGAIAGPVGLADAAHTARSLGARTIHAAILNGWVEPIPGIDVIYTLAPDHSDVAQHNPHDAQALVRA